MKSKMGSQLLHIRFWRGGSLAVSGHDWNNVTIMIASVEANGLQILETITYYAVYPVGAPGNQRNRAGGPVCIK